MDNLHSLMESYLYYCHMQKRLDEKTRKAYCIDLRQFSENIPTKEVAEITPETLENYIASLHQQYKPKTVKRKIATLKAFFHYLETTRIFLTAIHLIKLEFVFVNLSFYLKQFRCIP